SHASPQTTRRIGRRLCPEAATWARAGSLRDGSFMDAILISNHLLLPIHAAYQALQFQGSSNVEAGRPHGRYETGCVGSSLSITERPLTHSPALVCNSPNLSDTDSSLA